MAAITQPTIMLILDSTKDEQSVFNTLRALNQTGQISCTQVIAINNQQVANQRYFIQLGQLYPNASIQILTSTVDWAELFSHVQTDVVGYIPCGAVPSIKLPDITSNFLAPWISAVTLPDVTAKELSVEAVAWVASTSLAKVSLPQLGEPENWTILAVAKTLENKGIGFRWKAARVSEPSLIPTEKDLRGLLTINSTVLAVVPHYYCEVWLHRCLSSLVSQTRSLDGIVVIDDGSGNPPVSIVEQFPNVTLLSSPFNVGPYRLIQQVIEDTNYEAYLFQDADDWSSCDRLETLLEIVNTTQADLVGTQEIRVYKEDAKLSLGCYPLDVNAALAEKPGHPLLHPTSLVTRDLVLKLGGFATGLRFGGDTEFLLRANFVATIRNSPDFCYFRRKRSDSLTTAIETGLDSPARLTLLKQVKQRALSNRAAVASGNTPDLTPLATAAPVKLRQIAGPLLR